MYGADEEDDAGRDAENAHQEQERQAFRAGREQVRGAAALRPRKVAPAARKSCAQDELKNAEQHLLRYPRDGPPQDGPPTYCPPWVGPGGARISRFPATPEP